MRWVGFYRLVLSILNFNFILKYIHPFEKLQGFCIVNMIPILFTGYKTL